MECIPVLGQFATVEYEDQVNELPLIVVEGNGPNLQKVKLNWKVACESNNPRSA